MVSFSHFNVMQGGLPDIRPISPVNKLSTKILVFRACVTELESDWSKRLFGLHAPHERFWKSVLT